MRHNICQQIILGVLEVAKYKVLGRSIAGSFFVECLLRDAGIDYDFIHISRRQSSEESFRTENPLGRIPVLITPCGERIIESMAIFTHLVEAFPGLAPVIGDSARDRMWQHLAVMGTSLYPSMHRFHHTYYYGPDEAHDAIRDFALADMDRWLDYLETQLDPYLAGAAPMAADFYLFMITRWAPDKDRVLSGRPKIAAFIESMRYNPIIESVNLDREKPRGA